MFELVEKIGKYEIIREIGEGATSKVYLGHDPFANRDVAIKVFIAEDVDEDAAANGKPQGTIRSIQRNTDPT